MKFYAINPSINKKVTGHYPQTKTVIQNCDVWNEPKFIGQVFFQKIDFEPITANAVLFDKSKLTDLIYVVGMGFTKKLLVSTRLKLLIEGYRKTGLQFFASDILYKGQCVKDYWVLNVYEINMELIDFNKSTFASRQSKHGGGTYLENVDIKSLDDFNEKLKQEENYEQLFLHKIKIVENTNQDFFTLLHVEGGVKYVVSEKLKKEIEDAGCTGIEFQPVELSLNEWLQDGGEREKIYGKA